MDNLRRIYKDSAGHIFLEIYDPITGTTYFRKAIAGEDMLDPRILNAMVHKPGEPKKKPSIIDITRMFG